MKTNSFLKTLLFSSIILYSSYGNAQNIGGFAVDQYNAYYGATKVSSYTTTFKVLGGGFAVDQYK